MSMVLNQLVVPERVQIIGDGREGDTEAVSSLFVTPRELLHRSPILI